MKIDLGSTVTTASGQMAEVVAKNTRRDGTVELMIEYKSSDPKYYERTAEDRLESYARAPQSVDTFEEGHRSWVSEGDLQSE
jgi:hypothetical protein